MIGIYKITAKHNGKVYIGSSDNIEKRMQLHFNRLKRNVHHSLYLQSTYNKYGKENLEVSVIEVLENNLCKIEREQYWMDFYKSYDKHFGFNMSRNALCNTTGEVIIYQYDIEGNFIKKWPSIKTAQDTLHLSSIAQALSEKNNFKLCGGFQWTYYKKNKIESILKLYCCYSLNGDFIKSYPKGKGILKDLKNVKVLNLARAINEKVTFAGYQWRKYTDYNFPKIISPFVRQRRTRKIIQLDENNNVLNQFNSLTEAAQSINVQIENLHRAVSSNNLKYRTCHGFIWKYL